MDILQAIVAWTIIAGVVWITARFMRFWTHVSTIPATSRSVVVRHLRRTGHAHVSHVWRFEGVWNPAGRPFVDDRVFGPGEAFYDLDDSGTVRLEFIDRSGKVRRFSGPLPNAAARVRAPKINDLRTRKLVRRSVIGFAAVMITGFAIGYAVGGPSPQRGMEAGGFGQLAAISLALLVVAAFQIKHHVSTNSGHHAHSG